ncbi:MAG: Fe-S cluster assembly protein SufD [Crocinitomicaceae bacterium]|nr:Fe-S cluster assembly protein SufD [Crocinitomicaceae bacterium]
MEVLDNKITKFREGLAKTNLSFREESLKYAEDTLTELDFPTTRVERWKYTRVAKIANTQFSSRKDVVKQLNLPIQDAYTVVLVNGYFDKELSSKNLPEGVEISATSQSANNLLGKVATIKNEVFTALNTLYATDGVSLRIKAKTIVDKPIQLVHVITGENTIATVRNVLVSERFSEAEVVQVFLSENANASFTNNVSEIIVEEGAKLVLDKLQNESESNFHYSNECVQQASNSNFKINTITLNGGLVRNDLTIDVDGENCETHLNGAYILKGKQHVDNHTVVNHLKPNCHSNEMYKGVMDDQSTGVFNGRILVSKDSQKIEAYQSNGNVLLSDSASINSKPELEIYADNVKCSHGSTTGQLDDEAIYYLRTRGISEKSAKALMVTAFISDVTKRMDNDKVVEYVHNQLHDRFGWDF